MFFCLLLLDVYFDTYSFFYYKGKQGTLFHNFQCILNIFFFYFFVVLPLLDNFLKSVKPSPLQSLEKDLGILYR